MQIKKIKIPIKKQINSKEILCEEEIFVELCDFCNKIKVKIYRNEKDQLSLLNF